MPTDDAANNADPAPPQWPPVPADALALPSVPHLQAKAAGLLLLALLLAGAVAYLLYARGAFERSIVHSDDVLQVC